MEPGIGHRLFAPQRLGALHLPNRIVMASPSRLLATEQGTPTPGMADHYAARAEAGLLVTEASWISPEGMGHAHAPGIWRRDHVAAWRLVTDAVHRAGGRIALLLWHAGRVSHPLVQPGGAQPVGPSSIAGAGVIATPAGHRALPVPRVLRAEEMPRLADDFAAAAARAIEAGFDAVEIQAGNGYLLDQFLRSGSNRREDAYGGDAEGRTRLAVDVAAAVAARIGAGRTGFRVSPRNALHGMTDADPRATFVRLAERLRPLGLAWLQVSEPAAEIPPEGALAPAMRAAFGGALVLAGGQDRISAEEALAAGEADAIGFCRSFIAHPDLPRRPHAEAPDARPPFAFGDLPRAARWAGSPA